MSSAPALPELVVVGHATRDLLPGAGWRLGGTVLYAAVTASRLGKRVGIVTAGPPDVLAALAAAVPEALIAAIPSAEATTFENRYDGEGRRFQYLRGRSAELAVEAVPEAWRDVPLVLLAPLAQEVDAGLSTTFPRARIVATPQGWLRYWEASGLVTPGVWREEEHVLPRLAALILSLEDLLPRDGETDARTEMAREAALARIARWAQAGPRVVVTCGAEGAELWSGSERERFPAYQARQVDPTGAGDVFAAAFLCRWAETGDPRQAMDFANCAASFVVEAEGAAGIATRAQVEERLRLGQRASPN
jgi:1D-myo-inositol 3-kinase